MTMNDAGCLLPLCIHGVPRSGTSWLGEIFNSHPRVVYKFQPLFSYAMKDFIAKGSNKEDIKQFFALLASTIDPFLDQTESRQLGRLPTFAKERPTHICYKEVRYHSLLPNLLRKCASLRAFLIVRNPCATVFSWYRAPLEFRSELGWSLSDEWRYALRKNLNRPEEYNGFERWKEAARLFLHLSMHFPEQVTLVRYSSLLESPAEVVSALFADAGLTLHDQTLRFLDESRRGGEAEDRYSVYRGRATDDEWQRGLPESIQEEIRQETLSGELKVFWD